mmetsp:Transcript_46060/g.108560  ORF Transcript_46060/g.108560 Transcript_46060/m.108560 type:complete len:91 (-) Transcript_46060:11-283(-)
MAISAAVTGWMEFTSVAEKLSRYNSALVAFRNLLLWWNSLTQVEKASLAVVNNLVGTAENIICNEVNAWAAVQAEGKKEEGEGEEEKEEK